MDISSQLTFAFDAKLFASTYAVIFLAEIPDKTAMATLALATGKRPYAVLLGVCAAFVIQSACAVCFGSLITLLPHDQVRIGSGVLFIVFALLMWLRGAEQEAQEGGEGAPARSLFWPMAWKAFIVIFIAEWGDLTQLATATLAARSAEPLTIFAAATLALWTVTALAVFVGQRLRQWIVPKVMQRIAAVVFLVIGVLMLLGLRIASIGS